MKKTFLNLIVISVIISSCAVVNPGEVGVKQQFGKLKGALAAQGGGSGPEAHECSAYAHAFRGVAGDVI